MITAYFSSFNIFSEAEVQQIVALFEPRKLSKHDFFAKEGERCREVAFIESGIFRSYYTASNGEDITYCFRFPNDMLAAYSSFITGNASVETMQAVSDAALLVISREQIDLLLAQSLSGNRFLRTIAEQQYLELESRIFQLQKETALQKYSALLTHQPEYIQQVPLQYLASYLGISQRHLSRIRKEISF
jgi:CRP-like cAMP-binding protein